MQTLNNTDLMAVSGGCAEFCWGDFEVGDLAAQTIGGGIAGLAGGPMGAVGGAAGAALAYFFSVAWTD
ncbi:hypothetical protein ACOJR9_18410 [Alteromonas sp. A081]|uniref:hypothetical protein n=1 Tax=Alteromonas sp. A081 TaxID=3410269 RepID=UPI003B985547